MNEEEIRLDQTKKVFDILSTLIKNKETCSYRYLIYDLLGFDFDAYVPLISGLIITNMLVDFEDLQQENNNYKIILNGLKNRLIASHLEKIDVNTVLNIIERLKEKYKLKEVNKNGM